MKISEQCNIARLMTKSDVTDEIIISEVSSINPLIKNEASAVVDVLLRELDGVSFDKAFPKIEAKFVAVAEKYGIDKASLFWMYMEWRGNKK